MDDDGTCLQQGLFFRVDKKLNDEFPTQLATMSKLAG